MTEHTASPSTRVTKIHFTVKMLAFRNYDAHDDRRVGLLVGCLAGTNNGLLDRRDKPLLIDMREWLHKHARAAYSIDQSARTITFLPHMHGLAIMFSTRFSHA